MAKSLRWLVWAMGIACVAIGAAHFALGIKSVPGEGTAGATVDSRERFYGAVFLAYGLVWIWAARQSPIPSRLVQWLAGAFLLGGIGRLLSLLIEGRPQWFQLVLTAIEVGLPPLYFWLAGADERMVGSTQRVRSDSSRRARSA